MLETRMRSSTTISAVCFACLALTPAAADDAAAPVFRPAAGAIVAGLSGLVTGSQQSLTGDRTSSRLRCSVLN